jgi:potassium-transporting ATPase ATP-binding subunit
MATPLTIQRRSSTTLLGADALLRRNLLVWGLGGVILPFVGIKLIDVALTVMHLVA